MQNVQATTLPNIRQPTLSPVSRSEESVGLYSLLIALASNDGWPWSEVYSMVATQGERLRSDGQEVPHNPSST
jgi:hypothetical protein